ncbi:predicted protein [Arabidopsis lyrata subsp. lyrata]|uniref:Predicted protein n=1 Tax=Arabidopsis lyrata subsp. lyrata TaxID=81972 RepID=D7LQR5_ARALL|nr:predicted protein [Arabidopsis lyrata subsp. lyrata]
MYSPVRGRQEKQKFCLADKTSVKLSFDNVTMLAPSLVRVLYKYAVNSFIVKNSAVVAVVQQREFLMDIATMKKENKAEKKNLKEEDKAEKVNFKEEEAAEKPAANLKENAE